MYLGFDIYRDLNSRVENAVANSSNHNYDDILTRTFSRAVIDTLAKGVISWVEKDCRGCREDSSLGWKSHDVCVCTKPYEWITVKRYHLLVMNNLDVYDILQQWFELIAKGKNKIRISTLSDDECIKVWMVLYNFQIHMSEMNAEWKDYWSQQLVNHFKTIEAPMPPMISPEYSGKRTLSGRQYHYYKTSRTIYTTMPARK